MTLRRWLVRYGWAIIIAVGFAGLVLMANASPQETMFIWQDRFQKFLILSLGGVYLLVRSLSPLLAAVITVCYVFFLLTVLSYLVKSRRIPTIIPLVILLLVNCVIFSAPGLVLSPSVGDRVLDCEMFVTPQMGIQVIRYPVDVRLDYAEQQFFLVTHDGGQSWQQFADAFIYDPTMEDCQHIESFNNNTGIIRIERGGEPGEREVTRYMTSDGGHTWMVIE